MRPLKDVIADNPYSIFYGILCIALLSIVILYDNQFNKRIDPSVGAVLPFQSVGDRGNIFLTDKEEVQHLAAATHFGYNLNISPLELGDAEEIYEHLNEETPIDREKFFESAKKGGEDEYEIIQKDIPESIQERIQERVSNYDLKGVWLEPFKKREYVNDSLGAHVIGFVSVDENDITRGQYGIENIYDDVLSSTNKIAVGTKGTLLKQLGEGRKASLAPLAGNVTLTLDVNVQRELEKHLQGIQDRWDAKKVGGIIMNPHDGAILAMGAVPTFDPNNFGKVTDYSVFNNPNVEDVYEMGSVFKALTAAIGLDSRKVSINDTYNDRGSVMVDGEKISNFDQKGRGPNTSVQTILANSLNTGAVFMLRKIGTATFKDYIDEFQFNSTTQIDLPKEVQGLVENLESNREIEFATASFGQGIAVTPIAATRAFASIANGGLIVQPYVTKKIEQPRIGGIISGAEFTKERKRVFNTAAAKQVTDLLVYTHDRGIAGGRYRNPGYSIAAKTGTAQLIDPKTGGYAEGKVLHSFFGYFPAYNPKVIVFLYAVDPQYAQYASTTLPGPFSSMVNFFISYYAIPPDR